MNRTRLSPHALFVLGTLGGFNSNAFTSMTAARSWEHLSQAHLIHTPFWESPSIRLFGRTE